MARFRVGSYSSLVMDIGYVIQKKVWYGWKNWIMYDYCDSGKKTAIRKGKVLESKGHDVDWYI